MWPVTTSATVLFCAFCLSVLPFNYILSSPRPMDFSGTLQTCPNLAIHQMPSDFPNSKSHLTPRPPAHLFLIPQLPPTVFISAHLN